MEKFEEKGEKRDVLCYLHKNIYFLFFFTEIVSLTEL